MTDPQADPIAVAQGVLDDPRRLLTVATRDMLAICRGLVAAAQVPQISPELAGAARALIEAEAAHTLAKGPDGYAPLKVGLAREIAFLTFKRIFEEEFPNV
jgi:hypothetical protein